MRARQDWMHLSLDAPTEVVEAVLALLEGVHGYRDIGPLDWCVLERRQDLSRVTYAPRSPITTNRYADDWRDPVKPG